VRKTNEHWSCFICGVDTFGLICLECGDKIKSEQRRTKGSITVKQLAYIEGLISDMKTDETSEIIYSAIPDYQGSLDELSTVQAGILIKSITGASVAKKIIEAKK